MGVKVEIWSDIACPWCYIGKRRFETALERFEHRDDVEVTWRSFELDPAAPVERELGMAEHLAAKYGWTAEKARAANARVAEQAAGEGLEYRLDIARPGNTLDAHRLIHLAAEHGFQTEAKERLLAAYFTEGESVADQDTLVRLGAELGLERAEVAAALAEGRFETEVRADEREAAELGISGVPFFVLDRRYGVSGAQPPELLLRALEQAWVESHPATLVAAGAGPAESHDGCDDGTCSV
ncbi:MAG: DsbA family oxidoreductase [Candidatus Dormibacteraeota bacterium]|nr:DsbA family oxidoreductase [Candidatus Dormibacteraeota bacterium]